jgi:drug/metabolite transporter (DMT)-like permease
MADGDAVNKGVVFALGAAVLFGMSTPLAKTLVGGVAPLMLAGLLYAGSGLGLALVLTGRRLRGVRWPSMSWPRRGEWLWLAGAILFGGVAGPVALMYGLVTSAASTASLLLNLESVLTALLAWFLFRENFDRRIALGMLAIVAGGIVLAWTPGTRGEASPGLALIAVACLCWAIDNNLTRKVSANDAIVIAGLKGLVAGAVNLGLALLAGQALPPVGMLGLALAVGFLGYGVSLVLFVLALRHLGTARVGAYFSVAPFFGAALAVVVQGDSITFQLVAAGVLMALGVWLHLTEHHGHSHAHELQEHAHAHSHDEHHRHSHDFAWDGREPHSHRHVHALLVHAHAHFPDVHHRHPH